MVVSFLLPDVATGGGGRAVVRLANELITRGHAVRIFCKLQSMGFRARLRKLYLHTLFGEHSWLPDFRGEVRRYAALDPSDFTRGELVISMSAETSFDSAPLLGTHAVVVHQSHGAEFENWERMVEAWRMPTFKLTVSKKLAALMKKEVNQDVYGIVPNGVDRDEYHPSLPEDLRTAVGTSFRWSYSKDPLSTIRVFGALREALPRTPLLCFGDGKKPAEMRGVRYTRYPTVVQARDIYSRSVVWFMTSIQEGFGMPILEAMACGCVVVSTACGGPQDIIVDGENGFLVDVGNWGAIVQKTKLLLKDDSLRARMKAAALRTAEDFSWHKAGALLDASLQRVLAASGSPVGAAAH
jgi:glycosyltransferase involved in cell wall biosynthesis